MTLTALRQKMKQHNTDLSDYVFLFKNCPISSVQESKKHLKDVIELNSKLGAERLVVSLEKAKQ